MNMIELAPCKPCLRGTSTHWKMRLSLEVMKKKTWFTELAKTGVRSGHALQGDVYSEMGRILQGRQVRGAMLGRGSTCQHPQRRGHCG